jgi:hypothetical protein
VVRPGFPLHHLQRRAVALVRGRTTRSQVSESSLLSADRSYGISPLRLALDLLQTLQNAFVENDLSFAVQRLNVMLQN